MSAWKQWDRIAKISRKLNAAWRAKGRETRGRHPATKAGAEQAAARSRISASHQCGALFTSHGLRMTHAVGPFRPSAHGLRAGSTRWRGYVASTIHRVERTPGWERHVAVNAHGSEDEVHATTARISEIPGRGQSRTSRKPWVHSRDQAPAARKISAALIPPKAKLLDIAMPIGMFRATFGMTSRRHFSSGSWKLMVGGAT